VSRRIEMIDPIFLGIVLSHLSSCSTWVHVGSLLMCGTSKKYCICWVVILLSSEQLLAARLSVSLPYKIIMKLN